MQSTWFAGLFAGLAGAIMLLSASAAQAQLYHGNDTGGIISWSCENEAAAPAIAGAHCARFNKYPRITSVHRQYGDFIGFNCLWNPRMAPFVLPPVRTRSACYSQARVVRALY